MSLPAAFLFGIVAGLRLFTAEAVFFGLRGHGWPRIIFPIVALGEYIADATPWIPARTQIPSMILRILSGAFMGYLAARQAGAIAGGIGALIGTFGGYSLRIGAIARIGAIPAAVIEDLVAIGLAFAAITLL
jgi:uncharacterized membrane protein